MTCTQLKVMFNLTPSGLSIEEIQEIVQPEIGNRSELELFLKKMENLLLVTRSEAEQTYSLTLAGTFALFEEMSRRCLPWSKDDYWRNLECLAALQIARAIAEERLVELGGPGIWRI